MVMDSHRLQNFKVTIFSATPLLPLFVPQIAPKPTKNSISAPKSANGARNFPHGGLYPISHITNSNRQVLRALMVFLTQQNVTIVISWTRWGYLTVTNKILRLGSIAHRNH